MPQIWPILGCSSLVYYCPLAERNLACYSNCLIALIFSATSCSSNGYRTSAWLERGVPHGPWGLAFLPCSPRGLACLQSLPTCADLLTSIYTKRAHTSKLLPPSLPLWPGLLYTLWEKHGLHPGLEFLKIQDPFSMQQD